MDLSVGYLEYSLFGTLLVGLETETRNGQNSRKTIRGDRMDFIIKDKLDELTTIIKHRENSIKTSVFDIGKDLLYIKEKSLFKAKYESLKDYIEDNFSFTMRQAEKFMSVTTKFGGRGELSSLGITKLYLLTQVPDEHFDEIVEKVVKEGIVPTADEIKKLKS